MESRARCAGFSVMEIGNRKERLRVREAGASAAGRGQRPYASFPDRQPQRRPSSRKDGRLFADERVVNGAAELVGVSRRFALDAVEFVGQNDRADVMLTAEPDACSGKAAVTASIRKDIAAVKAQPALKDAGISSPQGRRAARASQRIGRAFCSAPAVANMPA